jgi:PAS domain S-box-containing protein
MGTRETRELLSTARARTKQSPSLRPALAELVLETMNEGVWLINADAVTTFVNRHTADLLGYTVDEMVGRSVYDFTDADGRAVGTKNFERRKRGMEEQTVFKCVRKDGSPIWLLFCSNPIFDQNDVFAGALGMVADFTRHKDEQVRLRARMDELSRQLEATKRELELERRSSAPADTHQPRGLMRDVLATSTVAAVLGTVVATVAVLAACGTAAALFGRPRHSDVTPDVR